jgi:hypothetical protein
MGRRGDDDEDVLGGRLWLIVAGITIGSLIAAGLIFLLIGAAWARWGLVGCLVFISAVALLWGLWYDHRHPTEKEATSYYNR